MINNNKSEFYERMKALLLRIPGAQIASGGREIIMPCRYCQDKGKHMYVSLPVENNIMLHNCYRASCGASGIVTSEKIIQWGLYSDPDDLIELSKYTKNVSSMEKNRKYLDRNVYRINNTFISENRLSEAKLNYINRRLGTNLTYDDLKKLKIVLNLKDILIENRINKLTRDQSIVNQLDESFIGFISQDNAFVNMRNLRQGKVHRSIDNKYINYNLFGKFDNTLRYYTLPTNIDLTNPKRIKLHIAEGPLDILSVYLNLRNREDHSIYSSILGGNYINIVKHFIHTVGLIEAEIHIYMDNDVTDNNILFKLKNISNIFQMPCYIHRNMYEGEKDFGVPLERIREQIVQL